MSKNYTDERCERLFDKLNKSKKLKAIKDMIPIIIFFITLYLLSILGHYEDTLLEKIGMIGIIIIVFTLAILFVAMFFLLFYRVGTIWGNPETRLFINSYGVYKFFQEDKSKKFLEDMIDELEDQKIHAENLIICNKENELKQIIDILKKYVHPNLGKTYDNEQMEYFHRFKRFSLAIENKINENNRNINFLELLLPFLYGKNIFLQGEYLVGIMPRIKIILQTKSVRYSISAIFPIILAIIVYHFTKDLGNAITAFFGLLLFIDRILFRNLPES